MEIKVLGSGCASCKKLLKITEKAVKKSGIEAKVLYVTDIQEITSTGLMSAPGLMINDKIVSAGRIPKEKEIIKMINNYIKS